MATPPPDRPNDPPKLDETQVPAHPPSDLFDLRSTEVQTTAPPPTDDDAVFLADEATGGPDSGGPGSGLFGRMERVPFPDVQPDTSGFLPMPPQSAMMTDIMAEAARSSARLADTVVPPSPPDPDSEAALGGPIEPTAPGSGWMPSDNRLLKETTLTDTKPVPEDPPVRPPSAVDFQLPEQDLIDQPSDIFTAAKSRHGGSDILGGATGESELYAGATSDVLLNHPPASSADGGRSDVLARDPDEEEGSSRFDRPERRTERVSFDLPPGLLATQSGDGGIGFDIVPDPETASERTMAVPFSDLEDSSELLGGPAGGDASDSNVLEADIDDGTAMDFDLMAGGPPSGVLLDNPDGEFDAGPRSSIFTGGGQASSGSAEPPGMGNVDLGRIPMMGSSDEGTDMMVPPVDSDGTLSVFQAAEAEQQAATGGDSGLIEWGESEAVRDEEHRTQTTAKAAAVATGAALVGAAGGAVSRRMDRADAPVTSPSSTSGRADLPAKPTGGRAGLGIAGLITGVAAGAGITFGLMNQPTTPNGGSGQPAASQPVQQPAVTPATGGGLAAGKALLAAGDPAAALAALEGATDDSAETKAARGRARWMARARQAAADNTKLAADDAELAKATTDLQAAADSAAGNNDPAIQRAGATAMLHLGLVKEAAGDPESAKRVYTDASARFTAFKRWFDSARQRVTTMQKNADGTQVKEFSRLPAEELDRLAGFGSLLLADFPPVQEGEDEAGFHFWEAINQSANWQAQGAFDRAIASISRARAAHDTRRRQLVGLGLNPLSDPREQMFLRACDELRFYWDFKKRIYNDPAGLELARKSGTGGAIAAMLAAVKAGGTGDGGPRLKEAETKLAAAMKSLTELEGVRKTAEADRVAKTKAEAALTAAKKEADELVQKLTADVKLAKTMAATATENAASAADRLKAADAALDPLISKLKAAKLIPESATRAEAMAALPEATKKAALVSGDSGNELAKQLADAQKKLSDAEAAAKLADDRAKAAMANADKETKAALLAAEKQAADLQEQLKTASAKTADEVKKAVAEARTELAAKLDTATKAAAVEKDRADTEARRVEAVRAETAKLVETRLAAQADQFRAEIAAARSGVSTQLLDVERSAAERAGRNYAAGVTAYFTGRYADAETRLTQAASDEPADARIVYFLGLAKFGQGKDAAADFRRAAALEARNRPGSREVGAALERVQGPARAAVEAYRP